MAKLGVITQNGALLEATLEHWMVALLTSLPLATTQKVFENVKNVEARAAPEYFTTEDALGTITVVK